MAKKQKFQAPKAPVPAADQPIATPEAPATAPVPTGRLRLPLPQARDHNKAFTILGADQEAQAAGIALTSKGTNPKKVRVYGYDNLADGGGKVPKDAKVLLVPGFQGVPKGVAEGQWVLLQEWAGKTVNAAYDAKVSSRTVRRAYRAGAIRFQKA